MIEITNLPTLRGNVPLRYARGHFATNHSHINYYIDITNQKIRLAEAKAVAAMQFAQYGMPNAPQEMIENFAKNILDNKEQSQKIYEKLYEQKVVESVSSKVKVTEKAVSAEDFAELAKNI